MYTAPMKVRYMIMVTNIGKWKHQLLVTQSILYSHLSKAQAKHHEKITATLGHANIGVSKFLIITLSFESTIEEKC